MTSSFCLQNPRSVTSLVLESTILLILLASRLDAAIDEGEIMWRADGVTDEQIEQIVGGWEFQNYNPSMYNHVGGEFYGRGWYLMFNPRSTTPGGNSGQYAYGDFYAPYEVITGWSYKDGSGFETRETIEYSADFGIVGSNAWYYHNNGEDYILAVSGAQRGGSAGITINSYVIIPVFLVGDVHIANVLWRHTVYYTLINDGGGVYYDWVDSSEYPRLWFYDTVWGYPNEYQPYQSMGGTPEAGDMRIDLSCNVDHQLVSPGQSIEITASTYTANQWYSGGVNGVYLRATLESDSVSKAEPSVVRTNEQGQAKWTYTSAASFGTDVFVVTYIDPLTMLGTSASIRVNWGVHQPLSDPSLPTSCGYTSCPQPVAQITPLTSRVENPQLSHIHTATDYQPAGGAAGCGPCGASTGGGGGLTTDIRLDRIHRYADFTRPGSFGPGVFSNLDLGLTLWNHGESGEIWDPSAASPIPLTRIEIGRYADQKRSAIASLVLHAADGTTVVEADAAVTATATQHDGTTWVFELIQAGLGGDADRQGRLTAIRDRAGNQVTIAYAFPADAPDAVLGARSRLLEMATATDQRGRRLAFAYTWTCGQPVVATLTYPTGALVRYHYDGDIAGVARIDYPDGTR